MIAGAYPSKWINGITSSKKLSFRAVFLLLMLVFPSFGMAPGDDQNSRSSLKDLPGVYVAVQIHDPDNCLVGLGLDETKVRSEAELRLRLSGIKVFSKESILNVKGKPFLYITILGIPLADGYLAYSCCVELGQEVILVSDPSSVVYATTWSKCALAFGQTETVAKQCLKTARDLLDAFLKAYSSVNVPKR